MWQSCVCILRKPHCPCFLFPVHALGNSYPTFRFLHAILNSFLKKLMEEKAHISYLLKYFLLLTLFSKYIHFSTRYSLSSWQCGYSEFFPLPFIWKCQLLVNSPLFSPLKMNIVYAYWRRRRKKRKVNPQTADNLSVLHCVWLPLCVGTSMVSCTCFVPCLLLLKALVFFLTNFAVFMNIMLL